MTRNAAVLTFLLLTITAPVGAATSKEPAMAMPAHSGRIADIQPAAATLVLEEMGPWKRAGTRPTSLTLVVTPRTTVEMIHRSAVSPAGWHGGYVGTPVHISALHRGDFVTVHVARRGRELVAASIDIVRPSGR